MKIFKSREDRRLEREVEIRKGVQLIKKSIRDSARNEKEYLNKARRAKEIGATDQLAFLKKTLKRSAGQRRLMERQLLNIETAAQIKNQAEAHAQFARAMNAVSRGIREMFGTTDMAKTQKDFEKAMAQAESLEQRMELFLDMSSESMFGYESSGEEIVSDAEVDRMIDGATAASGAEVATGLDEIRAELGKERVRDGSACH